MREFRFRGSGRCQAAAGEDLAKHARLSNRLFPDVFEAFNGTAEGRLANDDFFSQNFARARVFADPRRAMLSSDQRSAQS